MASIFKINLGGTNYDLAGITPLTSTGVSSTTSAFVATFQSISALQDGLAIFITNNKGDSVANCTLNVNSLGAKAIYLSNSGARLSTEWKSGMTGLFVYNSALNSNAGGWVFVVGLNTDINVQQNANISTNGSYPVMLGSQTGSTAVTGTLNKSSSLTYNPSTGALSATSFIGDGSQLMNVSGGAQPSSAIPLADSATPTAGTLATFARGDHVHPIASDNSKVAKAGDTMTGILTCQNNTSYSTKQARNIYILADGSSPSGGANGDVALFY